MPDHGEIWVPTPREQSCRSLANMFLIFETSSVIEGFALRYGNAATQLIPMYIYHETGQMGQIRARSVEFSHYLSNIESFGLRNDPI